MKSWSRFLFLLLLLGVAQPSTAQQTALDTMEVGSSGEAYAKAVRFRGIDRVVAYFDPNQPPPALETSQTVTQQRRETNEGPGLNPTIEGDRLTTMVIVSIILLGVAYLFVTFGGRMPVSFARDPGDVSQQPQGRRLKTDAGRNAPIGIQAILQIADRRLALVSLCKSLLARAVAAEGVLLQDSWTDRDTLRRVPRDFAHREALQSLVFASEKVQFGGRDVTEDEFRTHVANLQTLWTSAKP